MRALLLIISIVLVSGNSSAQLYLSDQAIMDLGDQALLHINNGDIENDGSIYTSGEIEILGDLQNTDLVESEAGAQSLISVSGDWINDGQFISGIGDVVFNGNIQIIGGSVATEFYNVQTLGALADVKQLLTNASVVNQMDIGSNLVRLGANELTLRNPRLPIKHTSGFLNTDFGGQALLESSSGNVIPYPVPFGYSVGTPVRRTMSLRNAPAGRYGMAFIEGDPSIYGMDKSQMSDSICRIQDAHFWMFHSDQDIDIAMELGTGDEPFLRTSKWLIGQWSQLPEDQTDHGLGFAHRSLQLNASDSGFYTINSQKPFVSLPATVQSYWKVSTGLSPQIFAPVGSLLTWMPDDQLSCSDCPNPIFSSENSELLNIQIENDGCVADAQIFMEVLKRDEVFMQNAFTPQGDGINETFYPVLIENEELIDMKIFNRWGEQIFEGTHPWDGKYKGVFVLPGVYVYEFTVRRVFSAERERHVHKTGTIQVMR